MSYSQEIPTLVISKGHHQAINSIDISPNDKYIASGSDDNHVKVYDLQMKQELYSFGAHGEKIANVLFSPDNKYLVSLTSTTIFIHSHPEGNLLHRINIGKIVAIESSMYINKKNQLILSSGRSIQIIELTSGEILKEYDNIRSYQFAVTSDESRIITKFIGPYDSTGIGFFDLSNGELVDFIAIPEMYSINFALTPDNKTLFAEKQAGKVSAIDLVSRKEKYLIDVARGKLNILETTPDGKYLITSGWDNHVKYWNAGNGKLDRDIADLSPTESPVSMSMAIRDVDYSSNGKMVAYCYSDLDNGRQQYTVEWFKEKTLESIGRHGGEVQISLSISIDSSGRVLSTGMLNANPGVKCFDLKNGSQKSFIPGTAFHGAGGQYLAAVNNEDRKNPRLAIYQMPSVREVKSFPIHGFATVSMSKSGKYAIAIDQKYIENAKPGEPQVTPFVRIWDIETEKEVVYLEKSLFDMPLNIDFSNDEEEALLFYATKVERVDIATGKLVGSIPVKLNNNIRNPIIPNSKLIANPGNGFIDGINYETGKIERVLDIGQGKIALGIAFSDDKSILAISCFDYKQNVPNRVLIYDWEAKKLMSTLEGESIFIRQVTIDRQNKHLYSVDDNGIITMWNLKNGKVKGRFLGNGTEDFIIITPEGYYKSSKGGIPNVGFRQKGTLYTFDQFDLKFNRPDKVLESIGLASEDQIALYRNAYKKRMARLGFDLTLENTSLNAPVCHILDEGAIPLQTTDKTISLRISAIDTVSILDRINIVINGVPIYGKRGMSIADLHAKKYEGELTLELNEGINNIQLSVMNVLGTESLQRSLTIESEHNITKPDLYVVSIGVRSFQDSSMNLVYSDKDANDFVHLFDGASAASTYNKIHTKTLTNENVRNGQLSELKTFLSNSAINDRVILFYSGHGLLNNQLDYYLSTYDVDFSAPEQNGIPFEQFKDLVDGIPARKRLILIDACNSGEIDRSTDGDAGQTKARFFANAGLHNSFELMKDLFVELRKESGATIFASSAGGAFSYESDQWQNGVFTFALKEAILNQMADQNEDKHITVSELKEYLFNRVSELTNGQQTPTVRQENLQTNWRIY